MSQSNLAKAQGVIRWLDANGFWNHELAQIGRSDVAGVGVFHNGGDEEQVLLRVPKANILSPKNSFLYSLIKDYEPENPLVDFTEGMHAIIIVYIYEKALGTDSPWHEYLESFDESQLPLCLWSESEKAALHNTECDLAGMLEPSELIAFHKECVRFGKAIESYVPLPDILALESVEEFGKCTQAVISRAFDVDKYHGLSLVPGADLFNHLSPTKLGESLVPRENVHFVCDDDLCGICGEDGCEHEVSDDDDGAETELEQEDASNDDLANLNDMDLDDFVAKMDQEEAETDHESEEEETIGDSDEQSTLNENDELSDQLADGSVCCDIILTNPPSASSELFNTYGNELLNAYLLQRYGFICPGNPNLTCSLSVPMFAHIKALKKAKKAKVDQKLEWFEEIGFDMTNEIIYLCGCGDCNDCNEEGPESWQQSPKIAFNGVYTKHTLALVRLFEMSFKNFQRVFLACDKPKVLARRISEHLLSGAIGKLEKAIIRRWVAERLARYKQDRVSGERGDMIEELKREEQAALKRALLILK